MWVYSVTTADLASTASRFSQSTASSGFSSYNTSAPAFTGTAAFTDNSTFSSEVFVSPFASSFKQMEARLISNTQSETNSLGVTASFSESTATMSSEEVTANYTGTTTRATTTAGINGISDTTTSSASESTTRGLASYASSTTTQTVTTARGTTTATTETLTVTTSTSGPNTTTTTRTEAQITTTTSASTITRTTLATVASTTLAAPVSLIPVSEAAATEQAWSVSIATDNAGFPSHVAATFTKRSGTLASTSAEFTATAVGVGFTSTVTDFLGSASSTFTTTYTLSAVDTHVPNVGSFPATATATRSFGLLSTSTYSTTYISSRTFTFSFTNAHASNYVATTRVLRVVYSATAPITITPNPTSTSATGFHVTWVSSAGLAMRYLRAMATSQSVTQAGTSTFTEEATYETTATTTETSSYTTSGTFPSYATTATTTRSTSTAVTGIVNTTYTSTYVTTTTSTYLEPPGGTFSETIETVTAVSTFTDSEGTSYTTTSLAESVTVTITGAGFSTTSESFSQYFLTSGNTTVDGGGATIFSTERFSSTYWSTFVYSNFESTFFTDFFFPGSTSGTSTFSETYSEPEFTTSFTTDRATYTQTVDTTLTATNTTTTTVNTTTSTTTATTTNITVPSTSGTVTLTSTETITTDVETSMVASYYTSTAFTYTTLNGASFTYPILHTLGTLLATADWSVHAIHPGQGWRSPYSLSSSHPIYSALSLSPAFPLVWTQVATQDDSRGPATPIIGRSQSVYTYQSTRFAVQYTWSDSRLHYTSGHTSGTTTASGTASFSGATAASWFSNRVSSRNTNTTTNSVGSVIGGAPFVSPGEFHLVSPPGVRHLTTQSGGTTSTSSTTHDTAVATSAGSSRGVAFPLLDESAYSVWLSSSNVTLSTNGITLTGQTAIPVFTISLNPNL